METRSISVMEIHSLEQIDPCGRLMGEIEHQQRPEIIGKMPFRADPSGAVWRFPFPLGSNSLNFQ
jgi:hypothetical protein